MDEENEVKIKSNEQPLTDMQLRELLTYASNIYGAYTPQMTNDRLTSIVNPQSVYYDTDISAATRNLDSDRLVGYSEWLSFTDGVVKRSSGYFGNLPSFDYTYACVNMNDVETEIQSKEYISDLRRIKAVLSRFDPKEQFSYIHRRTITSDVYYSILRTDTEKIVFQEMPSKYCILTGKSPEWGFVYDFNMQWFLTQGLSINQYPDALKDMWYRVFGGKSDINNYDPSNKLTKRKGVFGIWTQTSPLPSEGGFTCFKFHQDVYNIVPFFTCLFDDVKNRDFVRMLQNNQYLIASYKYLVGLIPLLKDTKSGQVADQLALDPATVGKFITLLKAGLPSNIQIGGLPFSDVKDISYELPATNMYEQFNTAISPSSGVTGRMIYATDKLNESETMYSTNIDEMLATSVYPQYSSWLTSFLNSFTKKYKFKFTFSGSNFWRSRKDRLDNADKLANRGMFIPQLYANALGYDPFTFEQMLAQSKYSDTQKLLQLPLNANTTAQNGRPKVEADENVY